MMKEIGNYYFPMEISVINDPRVERMIDEMGPAAFGIYMVILSELRARLGYKCQLCSLYKLRYKLRTANLKIRKVVTDYDLFELSEGEGDEVIVSSKYLNKAMEPLNTYRERRKKTKPVEEASSDEEKNRNTGFRK